MGADGRDHPRVSGEHEGDDGGEVGGFGSSPRERGALKTYFTAPGERGIIPA